MWLDNFLLLFGLLGVVAGIMGLFVSRGTQTVTYGLTTLIVASAGLLTIASSRSETVPNN
jgi:uncharacterized membrane-anchored protein